MGVSSLVSERCIHSRALPASQLYWAAQDLCNVQAASKGLGSCAKRVVRRKVCRTTNGMTRHRFWVLTAPYEIRSQGYGV